VSCAGGANPAAGLVKEYGWHYNKRPLSRPDSPLVLAAALRRGLGRKPGAGADVTSTPVPHFASLRGPGCAGMTECKSDREPLWGPSLALARIGAQLAAALRRGLGRFRLR